ncbi:MAG: DUF479 domain-containing protein [Lewinellaceae bacterium]|nr:DUF479 domain-containing protein [Lewinellaceae bacterium]
MNFLAHLALSHEIDEWMVGNFLADFIKPKDLLGFSDGIQFGIQIHRKIDFYTDHNTYVKSSIHRMSQSQGKYAAVVVDICYDYFLFKHWDVYYPEKDLDVFIESAYRTLNNFRDEFPKSFLPMFDRMLRFDFLRSCINKERLLANFEKLKTRVSFENNLHAATDAFLSQELLYEAEFLQFYPLLVDAVDTYIEQENHKNQENEQ